MPIALHGTVIDALDVPRLKSTTATVLTPDSFFAQTCRFMPVARIDAEEWDDPQCATHRASPRILSGAVHSSYFK
jgi:hypothetical protein